MKNSKQSFKAVIEEIHGSIPFSQIRNRIGNRTASAFPSYKSTGNE